MKYSEKEKSDIISAYYSRTTSVSELLSDANIPRSTFYGWLRKYNANQEKRREPKHTKREYRDMQTKIAYLEGEIEILKAVNCTVQSPLKERLAEIERLYGQYSVHMLCDALDVSRGTFYNHIKEALIKSDAHEGMDLFPSYCTKNPCLASASRQIFCTICRKNLSSPRTPRFNQRFPK